MKEATYYVLASVSHSGKDKTMETLKSSVFARVQCKRPRYVLIKVEDREFLEQ
jgi:hypothetical protein